MIEATSGDFILGADLYANGGSTDTVRGRGGLAILGGYDGASPGCCLVLGQVVPSRLPSMDTVLDMEAMVREMPIFTNTPN